jgi:hypothetical protein
VSEQLTYRGDVSAQLEKKRCEAVSCDMHPAAFLLEVDCDKQSTAGPADRPQSRVPGAVSSAPAVGGSPFAALLADCGFRGVSYAGAAFVLGPRRVWVSGPAAGEESDGWGRSGGPETGCMRVAIIGDIGGHLGVFEAALSAVGVDPRAARIPEDLAVVQVGDLVHKGPDSDACVALADRLLGTGRYVQLWGNHEAHYLGGPDVTVRPGVVPVGAAAASTLRGWYASGAARLAVAIDSDELGQVLVTHAGLTVGLWEELGEPGTPDVAAVRLNALLDSPEEAFRPGWLMTGVHGRAPGVTCARTGAELAGPWLARGSMPFSQVHGHEGVWHWPSAAFHDDCPPAVRAASTVDAARRFCSAEVSGRVLLSVDWVLGEVVPAGKFDPLVLCGVLRDVP